MAIPTPFHSRTKSLNTNQEWRNWSGYISAVTYEANHEREYYSIRNSCGLIDVSPLYKYEIKGPDALLLVDRIMTRDMTKCKVGQVMYSPWCDDDGFVIDDGTIARLSDSHFRLTAADPSLRWFQDCGFGLNVEVIDVSHHLTALAIQGPKSRGILNSCISNNNLNTLKYYRLLQTEISGVVLTITRTGYTGDLGYELWFDPTHAEFIWDILVEKGEDYGILPAGLAALDIVRIEAGLLLIDVDYISSQKALIPEQKSTPYDIGLGWTVQYGEVDFVGRRALQVNGRKEAKWKFIGLEIDWNDLEILYAEVDLPPQVAARAQRDPIPIYIQGKQVGQATSITFSPILKKYIALGTIQKYSGKMGEQVELEITVEYSRKRGKAKIVKPQFYNPARKYSVVSD